MTIPHRLGVAIGIAALLLAAGAVSAGTIGQVCEPGSFSATGFEPCTPCAPGTATAFTGADHCDTCPEQTFASESGRAFCTECNCDDLVACTHDVCDPVSAVCSAEAVPSCELASFRFVGTVTEVDSDSITPLATVGMSIEGSYLIDPLAPNQSPTVVGVGAYSRALKSFEMRVGPDIAAGAIVGDLRISNDQPVIADAYALTIQTGLVLEPVGFGFNAFSLILTGPGQDPFDSIAIPIAPPDPAAFGAATLELGFGAAGVDTIVRSDDFSLLVPEPNANASTCIAAAALIAVRRRANRRAAR